MKPINKFFGSNNGYKGNGHPAYVFAEVKDKSFYLDITHSKYVTDKRNPNKKYKYYPLSQNPNPSDEEPAYISRFPFSVKSNKLRNEKSNWFFSEKDLPIIENYKKNKLH